MTRAQTRMANGTSGSTTADRARRPGERLRRERRLEGMGATVASAAAVFDASPIAMALIDRQGRVLRANSALDALLGNTSDSARGLLDHLLHCAEPSAAAGALEVLEGRQRTTDFESSPGGCSPTVARVRIRLTTLRPASPGALMTVEDVSAHYASQRRAEDLCARLNHAARLSLAAELSGALAHELSQPLAAVSNYSQAALVRLRDSRVCAPDVLEYLASAECAARYAARVARSLSGFVKSQACRLRPTDLGAAVDEITGLLRATADAAGGGVWEHRVNVEVLAPPTPLMVRADPVLIQQVVLNLVKNGAEATASAARDDATREGVRVRIWSPAPGVAEVEVRDAGPGLSPEVAPRLFTPFVTTKARGMGLGLSICQSIIAAHGGELLGGNNPPPATGATFRFRLPLLNPQGDTSYDG